MLSSTHGVVESARPMRSGTANRATLTSAKAEAVRHGSAEGSAAGAGAGDAVKTTYERAGLAKLPGALDWLSHLIDSSAEEDKLVLFAHHRRVMRLLLVFAQERGLSCVLIDGETTPHDRYQRLGLFSDASARVKLALVSVTAGGQVSC